MVGPPVEPRLVEAVVTHLKDGPAPGAARVVPPDWNDPLLMSLVIVSRLFGNPKSPAALAAGLPLPKEGMTPALFVLAAERIGLAANTLRRRFSAITALMLPCVLLLKDGQACVLVRYLDRKHAEIITPDNVDGVRKAPLARLAEQYDGALIVVQQKVRLDARSRDLMPKEPRSWFWSAVFQFSPIYFEVVVAAALINVFATVMPLFMMVVYDRVVPNRAFDTLWVLVVGVAATLTFDFVLRTLRGVFLERVGRNLDRKLSSRIFEHLLAIRMASGPQSSGAMASRVQHFETVREFFTTATLAAIVDLPFILLFLAVISLIGGPIVAVPAVMIPAVIVVSLCCQAPMRRAIAASYRENQQKDATLVEAINSLDLIKISGAEGRLQRDWDGYISAASASGMKSRIWSSVALNFAVVAASVATIGVLAWGVYRAADGLMTTGAMVAASMLTGRAMAPVAQIAGIVVRFSQTWVALRGINQLMRLPSERPRGKVFLRRPKIEGAIEFRDVTFRYPGQSIKALDGVSFRIGAGERVGLVGRIGSGKTTLERLVVALFEPDSGAVLIDGIDIRQIDPADLRASIGCVLQDARLMFGSIKDNITLGAPYVDEQSVLNAATVAGVDQFVKGHPHGYDLQVGEGGKAMSGGQRQSVAIARALLMDPPILVLDEPTSSMDNSTETAFKNQLTKTLTGKTLLLVTHRNSMLSLVDRLIVMDGGKVVADGPKSSVLEALVGGRVRAAEASG